jgi:hypothetical protein
MNDDEKTQAIVAKARAAKPQPAAPAGSPDDEPTEQQLREQEFERQVGRLTCF